MMIGLMDALLSAVLGGSSEAQAGSTVLVHNEAYPGGVQTVSRGTFALDDSLGPNARFSIYYYDIGHVGNVIQLKSPSGTVIEDINMQGEDSDVNMIFINLNNAEVGRRSHREI